MELAEAVEPQLQRLLHRDKVRNRIVIALFLIALVAGAWGGKVISDLNTLLVRRTPVYAFLRDEARRQECLDDLEFANTIAFGNAALKSSQLPEGEELPQDDPTLVAYRKAVNDLKHSEELCPPVELEVP